jgi:hypothetical protein
MSEGARVTLDEAAVLLRKSVRQVRYLIQSGQLAAHKDNGRVTVLRSDLPNPAGEARTEARIEALRTQVEDALALPPRRDRYSVRDIKAFAIGAPLLRAVDNALPIEHPARRALHACLIELCCGCHRYEPADKPPPTAPPATSPRWPLVSSFWAISPPSAPNWSRSCCPPSPACYGG